MSSDPRQLHYPLDLWASYLSNAVGARITSTYRSYTEQARLFRLRQRVLSGELPLSAQPFPVAPPGTSLHEQRRAWDMVAEPAALRAAGQFWISVGGRWNESDPIHFEA